MVLKTYHLNSFCHGIEKMYEIVLIFITLSLALNVYCAKSKYNDDEEDRPYEFGFTIDGQQHRHEKKDANGIIQGEFGFITADGVYHVTVYATDENGNFKILSMRNVKISGPLDEPNAKLPDTSQFSNGNPPAPSPPITPNPLSVNPSPPPVQTVTNRPNVQFTTQPTIKPACAGCGYVTHKTPTNKLPFQTPAFQNPKPGTVVIGNDLIESSKSPTNSQGGTYPNSQAPFSRPQGGTYPNSPTPVSGFVKEPARQPVQQTYSNYTHPNTQPGQIYPDRPAQVPLPNRQTYPNIPLNNPENYPNPPNPSQETYFNAPSPAAGNYPNQPQDNPSYPKIYENNSPNPPQIIPEAPFVSNPIPVKPQPNPLAIQKPNAQSALGFANPTSVTDVPPAGITVANGMINLPNGPPIPIQDKYPNMVDGLPPSISKDDITDILYKFNYTVDFHGHYEKGYKNGAKVGGYFVTDRDGVSRIVTYVADENGYRPKVKFIRLDLNSDLVPKEGTEKQFGLKNFEFVWYPVK